MLQILELEEIRANCNCPARFHLGDFLGVGLATFFTVDALRRWHRPGEKVWAASSIFLASWMVWIHSRRFVYGSELGIQWEED
tara:strand:- start:477 stop:725 length:249 start_codon:yes stop_codon:yes gene_type:complete